MEKKKYILKFYCPDKSGILSKITNYLFNLGAFIENLDQFSDLETKLFFMRIVFSSKEEVSTRNLELFLSQFFGTFEISQETPANILILCSKPSHCINDLLHRWNEDKLAGNIKGVVSNHEVLKEMVSWYKLPYHYLPVTPDTKGQQEERIRKIIERENIDLIVLARYMQILSKEFCDDFYGKIINIHHSFLPAFKGANPYARAHKNGVKIIGATSHYVTGDLDEGPIITQDVISVNHNHSVAEYKSLGADIECRVLHRAIKNHLERRVFINGRKTVVLEK